MSFFGEIKHKRWTKILTSKDDFVIQVVKKIPRDEFIRSDHHYQVNYDIPMEFMSILLVMGESKRITKQLCQGVFHKDFLGYLNLAVGNVDNILMFPFLVDCHVMRGLRDIDERREQKFKCLILIVRDMASFEARKPSIARNIDFLHKWLG